MRKRKRVGSSPPYGTRDILDAIIAGDTAWSSRAQIAERVARTQVALSYQIDELSAEGWVTIWEVEGDQLVTLTCLAAKRLRVRLREVGPELIPQWVDKRAPREPPPKASPLYMDLRTSWAERTFRDERPTWPGVLLGESLTPFPGPDPELARRAENERRRVRAGAAYIPSARYEAPCPAAHNGHLKAGRYCLVCDAWSRDRKNEEIEALYEPAWYVGTPA